MGQFGAQPLQPLGKDKHGVLRFQGNALVRYLLDKGGIDMNHLATVDFPQEDQEQFAQLIGYSLSGFGELGYVRDETYEAASTMSKEGLSEDKARIQSLEDMLEEGRKGVRAAATALFQIHPDDLDA